MITRGTRGAPFDNRDDDFFRISRWGCALPVGEEKNHVVARPKFGRKFAPDSIHLPQRTRGTFGDVN
jgi:hypothetical protein